MDKELGRFLIVFGALLIIIGLVLTVSGRIGLGRLPGDISVRRGDFHFYVPLGTCLLLSIFLTVLLRLIGNR